MTPSQIASTVGLDSSTVTGILDRLEQKNLLKRTQDTHDRRVLRVSLTPDGVTLRESVMQVVDRCNESVLSVYSARERDTLIRLLQRLA